MAILSGDIKLIASQVMDDIEEGGGAPTSTVIQDGVSNSLFNDISELDRAGGRVNLRKVFASVQTDDTDTYLGGNVIVADPPDDPLVSVTIFSTEETFDIRTDARDRIEAYLNKGSLWNGYLLENHIAGQRSIQLFQRPDTALPEVGRTLCLIGNAGLSNEYFQYVRVTKVTSAQRQYAYESNGMVDYTAMVVTCDLSDALRYDFDGSPPSRFFSMATGKALVRDTVVADAARYCGVVKTTQAIAIGDVAADVASVFTQLVPSAQTETPLLDLTAGGTAAALTNSAKSGGDGLCSYTGNAVFNAATVLSVGNAIQPGSLSIATSGTTLTEDGGDLLDGSTVVGTVNYGRGEVAFASSAPAYSGAYTLTFRPGAAPIRVADTAGIRVNLSSRSYNYILTILPAPAPGTLLVSYRAQGKWYDLRDNGAGVLRGVSPEYGVGTVSYATGTVAVTVGALPDIGSEIIYAWGGKVNYLNRSGTAIAAPGVTLQLANVGITPATVTITWAAGGPYEATDDGKGVLIGAATGTIDYQTGTIRLTPNALPANGQAYTVVYDYGPKLEEQFAAPVRNPDGSVTLTLAETDVLPGAVEVEWNLAIGVYDYLTTTPLDMQYAPVRYYFWH